jgi:hypothetical protein
MTRAQTKKGIEFLPPSSPHTLNSKQSSKQARNNHRFLAARESAAPVPRPDTAHHSLQSAFIQRFPSYLPSESRPRTLAGFREMDEDWELLLASPKAAPAEPYAGGGGDGEVDAGAIKHDYFDLGSDAKYPRRASPSKGSEEECAEEGPFAASDNAGWVEPDPDDLLFSGRDRAALWSHSSSDGERPEVEVEAADQVERAGVTAAADAGEGAVAKGGGPAQWWRLPLDVLRVWALRAARSVWSVPLAVALLGLAVLGRRLYRMRRQSKAVARVRLVLDEKVTPSHHLPCTRLAPHLWISPSSRACWFFLGRL